MIIRIKMTSLNIIVLQYIGIIATHVHNTCMTCASLINIKIVQKIFNIIMQDYIYMQSSLYYTHVMFFVFLLTCIIITQSTRYKIA